MPAQFPAPPPKIVQQLRNAPVVPKEVAAMTADPITREFARERQRAGMPRAHLEKAIQWIAQRARQRCG
jgi:hypothetical protein